MDKTLNVSSVVTDANVEKLIQDMKESLISEKISEHQSALRLANTKNRQTVAEVRRDAENRIEHEAHLAKSAAEESRNLQ